MKTTRSFYQGKAFFKQYLTRILFIIHQIYSLLKNHGLNMKNDSNCQPSQKSIKRITNLNLIKRDGLEDTITEEISKCYLRLVVLATPVKLFVVPALQITSCKKILILKIMTQSNVLQMVYEFSFIVFFSYRYIILHRF